MRNTGAMRNTRVMRSGAERDASLMRRRSVALASVAAMAGFAGFASAVPVIDGTRDASGYTQIGLQTANSGFGDSNNGAGQGGSELDNLYYNIDNATGTLSLFLGGNLETNNNKLVLFFDTVAGGQNTLRTDNPDVNFNNLNRRYGASTVAGTAQPGFTFDAGFEADRFISFSRDANNTYVDYAELRTAGGGNGGYLGSIPVAGTGTNQQGAGTVGGNGLPTLNVGLNDNNVAGVNGAVGSAADAAAAAAVTTGTEFSIDLASLGIEGDFRITALINGSNHDYVSNQFIGGLDGAQGNLGGDGSGGFVTRDDEAGFGVVSGINLANFTGNQFVSIPFTLPTFAYNVNADGNYSNPANFTGNVVPTGVNGRVTFGNVITAPRTVTIDTDVSLARLTFDSANRYTLAGSNTITINGSSASPAVRVLSGSHVISAPVTFNADVAVETAANAQLTLSGTVTAAGRNLFKQGAGTLAMPATALNSFSVNAGTLRFTGTGNTVVRGATIDAGATLDLTGSSLIVDYDEGFSPRQAIKDAVVAGRIVSSTLAGTGRAIGYVDSAALPALVAFNGAPLDATALVFRETLQGDSNLDRRVDFEDLLTLARNYNGTEREWYQGDSNYNGAVNFEDLLALARNYNRTLSAAQAAAFSADFAADFALAQSLVPEPTVALAGLLAAGGLMGRRRK